MTGRKALAYRALVTSLRVRQSQSIGSRAALCVADLAEALGVEVRFMDFPSLDGAYVREPGPLIVASSLRPAGRRAFTIGHELAHHLFGHGTTLDRLLNPTSIAGVGSAWLLSGDELLADMFSGFLLMAPAAVRRAFAVRRLTPSSAVPENMFRVACWFGVGYATLIHHLASGLRLLPGYRARELLRLSPKRIKEGMLGEPLEGDLVVVDQNWSDRPIDIHVGDTVLLPLGIALEGESAWLIPDDGRHTRLAGQAPGISRVHHPESGWAAFIRVSRQGYVGRSLFRHLEETQLG